MKYSSNPIIPLNFRPNSSVFLPHLLSLVKNQSGKLKAFYRLRSVAEARFPTWCNSKDILSRNGYLQRICTTPLMRLPNSTAKSPMRPNLPVPQSRRSYTSTFYSTTTGLTTIEDNCPRRRVMLRFFHFSHYYIIFTLSNPYIPFIT